MIRRAEQRDRDALIVIYDTCFPGEQSFREWVFANVWQPENTLVFERDGHALSMLMDIPATLALDGERFASHYIYAAATLPEARGQKLMSALLARAFDDGVSQGQHFSTLITGNDGLFNFYRPFGYEIVSAVSRFSAVPRALAGGMILRPAQSEDLDEINAIYCAETGSTLAFSRGTQHFKLMLELYGDNFVVLQDEANGVKAYAFMESGFSFPFVSEIFGEKKHELARALCNQMGADTVFQGIAGKYPDENALRNGCIKPLTERGAEVLRTLKQPPYFNIMFN